MIAIDGSGEQTDIRRGGRVADCAALEMLCPGNRTGGSNPPLSVFMLTAVDI
jgi:hypothetical protein